MSMAETRSSTIESAVRHTLPNGMVALILQNTNSPTVSVRGDVRVGSAHEHDDQAGIAVLTGGALIRGTERRTFQQIVSETEERGATVNAGGGVHSSGFGGRSLSEDLPLVLEILSDMLITPTFPAHEVDRLRNQFLMGLRESEQETRVQASRALRAMLYPPGHPYSRLSSGSAATVQHLTRNDAAAFHGLYHPAATTLAVVGDVDPAQVIDLLEQTFGRWEKAEPPVQRSIPEVPPLEGVQRRDIPMAGKIQSDVIWAVHGIARANPDYYTASVANMILGRIGLGGRLGDNVRERQGLAYYCGSSLDADVIAGPWTALAGVAGANVERTIAAILHEIRTFAADGPDAQELSDAQDYMAGSMVLGLETNDGLAGTLLGIERHKLGFDYIARYPSIIRSITAEQVRDVVQRYLSTESYAVAIAGG